MRNSYIASQKMTFQSFHVFTQKRPSPKLRRRRNIATSPGGQNRRFTYNFQAPLQGTYVVEMIKTETQHSTHVENY